MESTITKNNKEIETKALLLVKIKYNINIMMTINNGLL